MVDERGKGKGTGTATETETGSERETVILLVHTSDEGVMNHTAVVGGVTWKMSAQKDGGTIIAGALCVCVCAQCICGVVFTHEQHTLSLC